MKCEICGQNDAVIHVQQIMGGEVYNIQLCTECALEKGIDGEDNTMDSSLSQLLNGLIESVVNKTEDYKSLECPRCGTKPNDIKKSGNMGCPDCYITFHKLIKKMLNIGSEGMPHKGKIPVKLKTVKAILIDREVLKKKLKEAVFQENYEVAAALRDRIKDLEHGNR